MRAPITDKHLLEMMWERFPEIMQRGAGIAAQPQQEPVAWMRQDGQMVTTASNRRNYPDFETRYSIPLYTSPPAQRTWVGLTDEDIGRCFDAGDGTIGGLIAAIEAKLKEKNT